MGVLGTVMAHFDLSNIYGAIDDWINDSLMNLVNTAKDDAASTSELTIAAFSFIGGTLWTMIIIAPLWYLWKGTGVFIKGGIFAFVIRVVFIVLMYLVPSLLSFLESFEVVNEHAVNITSSVFTWVIICIALLGLWIKS